MKKIGVIILLLVSAMGFAQNPIVNTFDDYTRLLSPEKLYLQTDREVYNVGDTVWFKGYLRNASDNSEYKECNYLYVEVLASVYEEASKSYLTKSGDVTKIYNRVKVKKDANTGSFIGYIPLTEDYNTGLAHVRAYSYWMLNSSPEYMYSKNIEIRNAMKDSFVKEMVENKITGQVNYDNLGVRNPFRKSLFGEKVKDETSLDIQFLPESGAFVYGAPMVMGVKVLNTSGMGVPVTGVVMADGQELSKFTTNFLGMGRFEITVPDGTKKLTSRIETIVENFEYETILPKPANQAVIIGVKAEEKTLRIKASSYGIEFEEEPSLVIYDRNGIEFTSTWEEAVKGRIVENNQLSEGINVAAVIDEKGNVYAERPFFVYPKDTVKVDITFDKAKYGKREKVSAAISVKDREGKAVEGDFSLAVTDDEYAPYSGEGHTIVSYMLLGSEIKGMIEKPQYYFCDTVGYGERLRDMDLLMMTQGWKYYDLEKILAKKTEMPRFGREYTQSLSGYVLGVIGKAKHSTLCFAAPSLGYTQIADLDSTSYFALNGLDFPDSTKFLVGAQGKRKLFKKLYTPVMNPEYFADVYDYPHYLKNKGYSEEYGKYASRSYYVNDGTITYSLMPSRIVAQKHVSPYPEDEFRQDEYRDEKQMESWKDVDVFTYVYSTCSGVRCIDNTLKCRNFNLGTEMSLLRGGAWVPIIVYINGFLATPPELERIMVSELDAFVYLKDSRALKYETVVLTNDPRYQLRPRSVVLVRTKNPVRYANNITQEKPIGWQRPAKFYAPKYESIQSKKAFEVMRSTLHWQPVVELTEGKGKVEFYTSDHKVPYTIIMEGITKRGEYVSRLIKLQ